MFGFSSSSRGQTGQMSSSPAPASSHFGATTCTANLFGSPASFSSSPFGSTYSTLEAPAPPSLFGTCRPSESAAPIYSSSFGSTFPASAPLFSVPLSGSTAPANLNLFGSAATPTLSGFTSGPTFSRGATTTTATISSLSPSFTMLIPATSSVSETQPTAAPPSIAATPTLSGFTWGSTFSRGATTTTATISSLSPSFTMSIPATSSVSETQQTAAPPSIGDDEIGSEDKQVSEIVEKVPIDQMAKIGEDQDEKQGTMVGGQDCANSSMDPTTSIIEVTAIPAKVHVAPAEQMATEANKPSAKEVDDEPPENSSTVSEVFDGDIIGHSASGILSSHESSSCADFEDLALALQNSSPSQYAPIFNQILGKYGDISNESKLKSMEAKATFFQLLAKVVECLSNHTVESLDSGELQRMQEWIDDAEAVGFKVKWLQQRFKNIVTVSKYQECLMQFNEIGEQISATKIALREMELRQITLKEEVDAIKVELDGDNFDEFNLCEGLF